MARGLFIDTIPEGVVYSTLHIKAETKWLLFCLRHFQMHFLEHKLMYFDEYFIQVYF